MKTRTTLALTALCCLLTACGYIAVASAPKKVAATTRTQAALDADVLFWDTFHGGKYDQIQTALERLTAAYLANPGDDITAAHIGWMHIWRISESGRLEKRSASITDDMVLARRYFQEAVNLHPGEARYQGFLASTIMGEGVINKDEKLTRQGYYTMLDAVDAWPEFNLFTAGYTMSRLPADSPRYKDALQWQWKNMDVCAGETVSREEPDVRKYMHLETKEGTKRVCWNSDIAPHNFEGFFLNMGDMLVKNGEWQLAQKMYANAKLSATYSQWKYGGILEDRIKNASDNVARFRADTPAADKVNGQIMIKTPIACMACHQQ